MRRGEMKMFCFFLCLLFEDFVVNGIYKLSAEHFSGGFCGIILFQLRYHSDQSARRMKNQTNRNDCQLLAR